MRARGQHVIRALALAVAWVGPATPAAAQAAQPNVSYSFHVGSAHPLGTLDSLSDANIHVDWIELPASAISRTKSSFGTQSSTWIEPVHGRELRGNRASAWLIVARSSGGIAPPARGCEGICRPAVHVLAQVGLIEGGSMSGSAHRSRSGVRSAGVRIDFHQIQTTTRRASARCSLGVLFR